MYGPLQAQKLIQLTLPPLSLIALLFLVLVHSQDSTVFDFSSFTGRETDLTYQGEAYVPPGSRQIFLTGADGGLRSQDSVGRVLYSSPVLLWERAGSREATIATDIRFFIRTFSTFEPGEGITFFIAPVNTPILNGSDGGNLGIFNSSGTTSQLFAVEFDAHVNPEWDPNFRHIGINVNSRISKAVTRFDNPLGQEVEARIAYAPQLRIITVEVSVSSQNYSLIYNVDLKTILPERVQVGLSASTGSSATAGHEIRTWSFTSTLLSR